jgi:TPR repeat protein
MNGLWIVSMTTLSSGIACFSNNVRASGAGRNSFDGDSRGGGTDDKHNLAVQLYQQAAEAGSSTAAIEMARAYLGLLPSSLPYDVTEATRCYQIAISSREPHGYYGMAALWLSKTLDNSDHGLQANHLPKVVEYLELVSKLGHPFAMFNLGLVHVYGYGNYPINTTLAAEWFIESGLPEGYFVASFQARSVGRLDRAHFLHDMAIRLGQGATWRRAARQYTGWCSGR